LLIGFIGTSVLACSASAKEFIADAVPLEVVVQSAGAEFGSPVNVCSNGKRLVSGRFNFREPADIAGLLLEKGFPVSNEGGTLKVGCDQASIELDQGGASSAGMSATSPFSAAILGGDRSIPHGSPLSPGPTYVAQAAAPPPPPQTFRAANVRYRDPSKVIATLSKLPGLSVIADPQVPGPLLLVGSASIVSQAEKYLAAFDTCPRMAQVEATIVTSSTNADRSRAFGVQIREPGASLIGAFDPLAGATVSIPGLRLYLDGMRQSGEFRTNASLRARVLLGETVKVQDGSDVPVRAATSVTDRETRTDIVYRQTGNRMTVKLLALEDGQAVVQIEHELSSQSAQTSLGPTFSTRSVSSLLRVDLGQPNLISLSGADTASKTTGRGIFSRSDATSAGKAGAFLVFAVERVPCGTGPGPQRSEDRKPGPDGIAGDGKASKKARADRRKEKSNVVDDSA